LPQGVSSEDYGNRLPADVEWYGARCSLDEIDGFYHRCGVYAALSGNTCRVADSSRMMAEARHVDKQASEQAGLIRSIVKRFDEVKLRPLHLATNNLGTGPYHVLDPLRSRRFRYSSRCRHRALFAASTNASLTTYYVRSSGDQRHSRR
jgi:hypothetical protein